jgi:hypothetical protein
MSQMNARVKNGFLSDMAAGTLFFQQIYLVHLEWIAEL